jgi:hypothetical protein
MRFALRHLLLLTTLTAAVVAAAAALPTLHGTLLLLTASLILPGVLVTIALTGGADAKALCLPAIVPLAFGIYGVAWAFGWFVFQASDPNELLPWLEAHGRTIKTTLLCSWFIGALAGLVCVAIHVARTRPSRP